MYYFFFKILFIFNNVYMHVYMSKGTLKAQGR